MSIDDDLATVDRLLASEGSIPVGLRMRRGLDEDLFKELTGALERLTDHFQGRADVPKALALAFVDVGSAFWYPEGAYPPAELERIEDAGNELSLLGQNLFSDED